MKPSRVRLELRIGNKSLAENDPPGIIFIAHDVSFGVTAKKVPLTKMFTGL